MKFGRLLLAMTAALVAQSCGEQADDSDQEPATEEDALATDLCADRDITSGSKVLLVAYRQGLYYRLNPNGSGELVTTTDQGQASQFIVEKAAGSGDLTAAETVRLKVVTPDGLGSVPCKIGAPSAAGNGRPVSCKVGATGEDTFYIRGDSSTPSGATILGKTPVAMRPASMSGATMCGNATGRFACGDQANNSATYYYMKLQLAACPLDQHFIQDRIDALPAEGGEVRLPKGTFMVFQPVLLRSNVKVTGSGPDTVLRMSARLVGPVFTNRDWAAGAEEIEIAHLTIDGNAGARSESKKGVAARISAERPSDVEDVAIFFDKAERARLHHLQIRNLRNEGIFLRACDRVSITDNVVTGAAMRAAVNDWSQGAIYTRDTQRSVITDNTIANCYEGGIVLGRGSDANYVARNEVKDGDSGEGVFVGESERNVVVDNDIENASHADGASGAGIAVFVNRTSDKETSGSRHNLIARNTVAHTGGSGISLYRSDANYVVGNSVSFANEKNNEGSGGISGWDSTDLLLIGNTVTSSSQCPGIRGSASDRTVVRSNQLQGTQSPQIRVDGQDVHQALNVVTP